MYKWPYAAWTQASIDAWTLGAEASTVIGMRMAKMAVGGAAADKEAQLMVSEKMQAMAELQMQMLTGGLGTTALSGTQKTLKHYKKKVAANRKRLG
ncbi:hypothetical protein OKW76_05825 [Sphingomonas sp. S1-29]|uniref:Uncharacterized protein n=1 Tax=Sphingomonas qomolangmaensis TaxID=2918765 RepID=A0ABY5LAK6_9SPHN|nr:MULTISPECIES: hypothetical protein [Sphingomonas]UUL83995.1 hypothetical protein NMP03_07340 [Sphingomonas qomolangmaensis]UZK70557.1 hypothetical protein OKW76_05825 [Sphingomonas sp. S1-29]